MKLLGQILLLLALAGCSQPYGRNDMDVPAHIQIPSQEELFSGGNPHNALLERRVDALLGNRFLRQFLRDGPNSILTVVEQADAAVGEVGGVVSANSFDGIPGTKHLFRTDDEKGAAHLDIKQYGGGIFVPSFCLGEAQEPPPWQMNLPLDGQGQLIKYLSYNMKMSIECGSIEVEFLVKQNEAGSVDVQELILIGLR